MSSQFWNFCIETNVLVYEQPPSKVSPVHPEVEIVRGQYLTTLRSRYAELCQNKGIEYPHDSFNRWLLEMKVSDRGEEPLLPSDCPHDIADCITRDTIQYHPVQLMSKPGVYHEAKSDLKKYAEAVKKMVANRPAADTTRYTVELLADESLTWLRTHGDATIEDISNRLCQMKEKCGPLLSEAVKDVAEEICKEMYRKSRDLAKRLQLMNMGMLENPHLVVKRRVKCHSIKPISLPCQQLSVTSTSLQERGTKTFLLCAREELGINTDYLNKLEGLYHANCSDDPQGEMFLTRVWCLLKRYQTFFGSPDTREGVGLQRALPVQLFEYLQRVFDVTFECFASPLNCYFKQFCSAFPDTDGYFGSRGSILDFHPLTGSFEAGPPFSEELEEAMVDHFENLLDSSLEPLSFIVFIPDWRDPPAQAVLKLDASRFNRGQTVAEAYQHVYRHGLQHAKHRACEVGHGVKAGHGTLIVFLQNEAGFIKWKPSPERIRSLLRAFSDPFPRQVNH